jgi:DNA-binding IclR family transcriptional regulator
MEHTGPEAVPIQSVGTMFELLMELQERESAGVTELADSLGVAKSTVHNHLATLQAYEYVVSTDDGYRIGVRFLDHGGHARSALPGHELIKGKIREVAEETGELVQYLVEEHGRGVFVFRETGAQAVRTKTRLGKRVYLHHVSAGKALLAHMSDERVNGIIDRHGLPPKTHQTITIREDLFEDLREIRERGYVFDEEEHIKGLYSIGVPIVLDDGEPIGAMSIAGPPHRIQNEEKKTEFVQLLRGIANEIELNLTY